MNKKDPEYWKIKECVCERANIRLYITWKHDITTHITDIVAICRTKEAADKYAIGYKKEHIRTWVDECITEHAFGSTMFGKRQ